MFQTILTIICILCMFLCYASLLKRNSHCTHTSFLKKLLQGHSRYGIGLLVFSLLHGIFSPKSDAMISGKVTWLLLLILLLSTLLRKYVSPKIFKKIHLSLSLLLGVFIGIHIVHALFFS